MKCSYSFGLLRRRPFQPQPQGGTRRHHKYRVKLDPCPLVVRTVYIFVLLSFALAANCLAAASLPPDPNAMGRRPNDLDKLLARARANGCSREEHREQNAVPDRHV
jgi:hypothetical protein